MAVRGKVFTNPRTGESLTTAEWCRKLGISRTTFVHRKQVHGMKKETFAPNRYINAPTPWQDWEVQFLMETYESELWTIKAISDKLERKPDIIRLKASKLGLKSKQRRTPSHNWLHLWRMHNEGLSSRAISRVLGANHASVLYALKKIGSMSESDREKYWATCGYI